MPRVWFPRASHAKFMVSNAMEMHAIAPLKCAYPLNGLTLLTVNLIKAGTSALLVSFVIFLLLGRHQESL